MNPHPTSLADLLVKFQVRYSEFNAAGVTRITAALSDARDQVDPDVFGIADDQACMALGAHILAMSPAGNPMRIKVDGNPTTTYKQEYDRLVLQYAVASRPLSNSIPVNPWGGWGWWP